MSINRTTATQVHWLVWGIPGTATSLAENLPQGPQLPDGSRQISASGQIYRGPGARAAGPKHHYTFELYALDTTIDVPMGANEQETRTAVHGGHPGPHPRQGGLHRALQAAPVAFPSDPGRRP